MTTRNPENKLIMEGMTGCRGCCYARYIRSHFYCCEHPYSNRQEYLIGCSNIIFVERLSDEVLSRLATAGMEALLESITQSSPVSRDETDSNLLQQELSYQQNKPRESSSEQEQNQHTPTKRKRLLDI